MLNIKNNLEVLFYPCDKEKSRFLFLRYKIYQQHYSVRLGINWQFPVALIASIQNGENYELARQSGLWDALAEYRNDIQKYIYKY